MVEIRRAVVEDLPEIHRVWWATGSSPGKHNPWFAHVLSTGVIAVAIDDGQLVGFAGHRRVWQTGVVSDCFVDPPRQGTGIGTRMLTYLLPDDGPLMTLASDDPKAQSLYRKWGMRPVVDCPYLQAKASGDGDATAIEAFPIPAADLGHLETDLSCRFVRAGESVAAITGHSIESSLLARGDDAVVIFERMLNSVGSNTVEIQMSESHRAFGSFDCTETFRDTLMATPGAQIPDPHRVTYNGDLLAIGA